MFTKSRMILITTITALMAFSIPLLADEDASVPASPRVIGFFETHTILTELITLSIFALLFTSSMASNTTTETIRTDHRSFWNRPLGSSYTHINVAKTPSSPSEIKHTLIVMGVVYLVVRLTCMAGLFNVIYQCVGSLIDTVLKL